MSQPISVQDIFLAEVESSKSPDFIKEYVLPSTMPQIGGMSTVKF